MRPLILALLLARRRSGRGRPAVAPRRARPVRRPAAASRGPVPSPPRPTGTAAAPRDRTACIARASYIPDVCRTIEAAARAQRARPRLLRPPALEGEPVRRRRGQPGRGAGHRPVHARHRQAARPRGRLQPGRGASASARLPRRPRPRPTATSASPPPPTTAARRGPTASSPGAAACPTRPAPMSGDHRPPAEAWRDAPPAAPRPVARRRRRLPGRLRHPRRQPRPARVPHRAGAAALGGRRRLEPRRRRRRAPGRAAAEPPRRRARRRDRSATPAAGGRAARPLHLAQVGRPTRAEADALCARLRGDGGDCMVLRN